MAHERLRACQTLGRWLRASQGFGFELWAKQYRGDVGIALSKVRLTGAFWRDFDRYFCRLFDGARRDSGEPLQWSERLLAQHSKQRLDPELDPKTKTPVFSDGSAAPHTIAPYPHSFMAAASWRLTCGPACATTWVVSRCKIVPKMSRCNG